MQLDEMFDNNFVHSATTSVVKLVGKYVLSRLYFDIISRNLNQWHVAKFLLTPPLLRLQGPKDF